MNQKEWDRMIGQELYDPFNVHDDSFQRVHAACGAAEIQCF